MAVGVSTERATGAFQEVREHHRGGGVGSYGHPPWFGIRIAFASPSAVASDWPKVIHQTV